MTEKNAREMSIAFQNHTDITSRHLNPYPRYENALKVGGVFKPPGLLMQKQSCDAVEETRNEFTEVDEHGQASALTSPGMDEAILIPRRTSVISSTSPTAINADLELSKSPSQISSRIGNTATEIAQFDDSETTTVKTTTLAASSNKNFGRRSSDDATKVSNHSLAHEKIRGISDPEVTKGFVNVHLEGFSHFFPHNLHTLHRRQLFCDVTVRAHNKDIHAHKVVLAACSPYFYRILENDQHVDNTSEIVSDYHRVIDLGTSVTASGLQYVLDCMYTSSISLSEDNVQDIFEASSYLDMQLIVQACLEFMEKWKTDDVTRKQYIVDGRNRRSSEESVTDLKVITKETHGSIREETIPASSCNSAATTSVLAKSIYDTEGDAIYQNISRQKFLEKESDSRRANSTDHKPVSPIEMKETVVEPTSAVTDTHFHSAVPACVTDSDDDVFVKKESSPTVGCQSSDSGLHDSAGSTPSTPGSHDAISAAEALRRRQSEFYRHVLTNNPYLLNPEAMAAAVAMTSLTSPLRSPSNQAHFPIPSVEQSHLLMKSAWHHIFGQSLQPHMHSNPMHRHHGHVTTLQGGLQPSQYMDILHQQRMRQHAILNLSRSAPKPRAVDSKVPSRYSPNSHDPAVISLPYSPMMLSSLLQKTHDLPSSRSLKRSISTNSADHQTLALDKPSLGRFSHEKPVFPSNSEGQNFSSESTTTNCQSRLPKRRRSTSGRSRSPDRPYKCMVCAAEFNRPANLKTHMRIHSGEKPYKCQSCGARFVQVAHLRAHILIHTGEKPYPCKVCGTRFRHLQTLKSHFRIHTGEKPYACEECQVKFRHKSQLRLHLRTKHGINTNTKKTYQQVPGLNSADISAHIKRTQEAVRMQSSRREF